MGFKELNRFQCPLIHKWAIKGSKLYKKSVKQSNIFENTKQFIESKRAAVKSEKKSNLQNLDKK